MFLAWFTTVQLAKGRRDAKYYEKLYRMFQAGIGYNVANVSSIAMPQADQLLAEIEILHQICPDFN